MISTHGGAVSTAPSPNDAPATDATVRMDMPGDGWTLHELYSRALWEDSQIGKQRRCASNYWYFGKIMLLVRAHVPDGQWTAWCREHGIQRDRWKRGRHLALAFAAPDDVAGMTVEAADALAHELLGLARRQSTADAKLRRSLAAVKKMLNKRLDEFESVTKPAGLRPRIAELKRQLTALDHACVILERSRRAGPSKHPHAKRPK